MNPHASDQEACEEGYFHCCRVWNLGPGARYWYRLHQRSFRHARRWSVIADAAVAGLAARSAAAAAVADKVAPADETFVEVETALAATEAPAAEVVAEAPVTEVKGE